MGELYTITEHMFHDITSEHQLPVNIDAETLNNHIVSI